MIQENVILLKPMTFHVKDKMKKGMRGKLRDIGHRFMKR